MSVRAVPPVAALCTSTPHTCHVRRTIVGAARVSMRRHVSRAPLSSVLACTRAVPTGPERC
eukprot:64866-Chlamydomonas_euryale.AAC.2